jgi:flagellar basal-body rod protein FlgF
MDAMTAVEAGMLNDVERLRVIGHNLANVTTTGFKREVAVARPFFDYLDRAGTAGTAGTQISGARPVLTTYTDQRAGAPKYTANPLDLLVEGNGFFVVSTPTGEAYTRQGNFQVDAGGRLVTAAGLPVVGVSGEISLTTSRPQIDQSGQIMENGNVVGQIKVVNVADAGSLERLGAGLFGPTESTDFVDTTDTRVRQGHLEAPNVTSMTEMVKLIETMRHFEMSEKLIRGYDSMLERAITDLGDV